MSRPISILVADDLPVVREGIRRMLEVAGRTQVVGEAGTSDQAVRTALRIRPDVILLDMRIPKHGGIAAIRRIRERMPDARIIALTLYGEQYLVEAIRAGAMGYLLKDTTRQEMLRAISQVMKGKPYLDSSLGRGLAVASLEIQPTSQAASKP